LHQHSADGKGGRRCWRGCIAHVEHASRTRQVEVLYEASVPSKRLCPNAARAEPQLLRAELGNVSAQLTEEGPFRDVAPHFREAGPHVPAGEAQEAGEEQRASEIRYRDIASPVAPAREGQDRVRACPHLTVDPPREMHAQEWEMRIGHRINEPAHQVPRLRREGVVVATERHDARCLAPGTWLAAARWCSSSSRGSSSSVTAITSFPTRWKGMSCCSQKDSRAALPSRQRAAFSGPGG